MKIISVEFQLLSDTQHFGTFEYRNMEYCFITQHEIRMVLFYNFIYYVHVNMLYFQLRDYHNVARLVLCNIPNPNSQCAPASSDVIATQIELKGYTKV